MIVTKVWPFDSADNLWVANEGDNKLLESTPTQLETSASPTPNTIVTSTNIDSPVGLAFDSNGGLWVANDFNNEVLRFTSSQLAAGGAQTPSVVVTSNGSGIARAAQVRPQGQSVGGK